jgi:hypothetical protein
MASTSEQKSPSSGPLIGIVTVTYNSAKYLDAFFRSCTGQTLTNFRLYAIDNASSDSSATDLVAREQEDSRVRTIFNTRNLGVAAANNQGIVRALREGCEWVLLLNNDTSFAPDFLAQLSLGHQVSGRNVIVPKIHYDTPVGHIWYAGGGFNAWRGHTGYHSGLGQRDDGQFDRSCVVDYAPTCAMLVHRDVFARVGLMDETYFVYFDDTDFCWRLRQHDIEIGYWPAAMLVHKVGGSTGGTSSPFTAEFTARNRLYFLRKHFGKIAPRLWIAVFVPYYALRYLLLSWNPACFRASIRGSLAYTAMTPCQPEFGK